MTPEIGFTTQVIRKAKWYKYVYEFGLNTIEINRHNSKLHFNQYFLEKVKKYLRGFNLSIHSGTAGIFDDNDSFTRANLAILYAELEICKFLGAKQLIFHLNDGYLDNHNKQKLKSVLSHSNDYGIEMLFESNSNLVADYAYDTLESFPDMGYVLDLGHLNNGNSNKKLGCAVDDFIKNVRDRVVYVHASNNNGYRDEHNDLENGTLEWRSILDMLDITRVKKIIIEVSHSHMVENTLNILKSYFGIAIGEKKSFGNDLNAIYISGDMAH
ncbi:MAG: TIM barrel protein [Desulfarculus sp.]|nr:TIM barrel protein [Desulfarculus sp.]